MKINPNPEINGTMFSDLEPGDVCIILGRTFMRLLAPRAVVDLVSGQTAHYTPDTRVIYCRNAILHLNINLETD